MWKSIFQEKPENRPSFDTLVDYFDWMLTQSARDHEVSDIRCMSIRKVEIVNLLLHLIQAFPTELSGSAVNSE